MRQLTYIRKGSLEWREVAQPQLQSETDALVRPFAVARCDLGNAFLTADLSWRLRLAVGVGWADRRVLRDFGSHPFKGPFAYGHECASRRPYVGASTGWN